MTPDIELRERADLKDSFINEIEHSRPLVDLLSPLEDISVNRTEFINAPGSMSSVLVALAIIKHKCPFLYIAPDIRHAERARDDLRTILGEERVFLLPPQFTIPYDPYHHNSRFDERAGVFERLLHGDFDVIIAVPASLLEKYEPLRIQKKRLVEIKVGDDIDRDALALVLAESGMNREIRAEEPGQFAIRGSVIDIYPASASEPYRLELWGDEISEIRTFDPETQRSLNPVQSLQFYAGEQSKSMGTVGLWELLPRKTKVFYNDPDSINAGLDRHWEEIEYQYEKRKNLELDRKTPEPLDIYFSIERLHEELERRRGLVYRGPAAPSKGAVNLQAIAHESFLGELDRVVAHINNLHDTHYQPFIFCDNASQVDRIKELLDEHGGLKRVPPVLVASIHGGFTWPDAHIAVLTDHEIFGRHKRTAPFRKRKRRVDPATFEEFKQGDFVVHAEFGIGRFVGLKNIKVGGVERECVQIEFKDNVKVYVRLDKFGLLQKYQGTEGAEPKLSKIGGADWTRSHERTKKAVEKLAKEILEIYARRQIEGGFPFQDDTPWQREMEAAFEFEDTPDQTTSSLQVKQDMEKPVAMDRILVGDVGFGKTEVAVRAAFKAIQDSKQVAILVPTTILAQQHYTTFIERLRRYPIRVEVLSRFVQRKRQEIILDDLEKGEVDLVIGTHRLLSKDIKFKDLGLLVIDEEHRFGVKHKEKLRSIRASVDVLSMSATPIPRTLHMALAGARDMSMISTPPQDRLPIETEVTPFDERLIREAILREVGRGGQVYFVHNRVETIHNIKHQLEILLPNVKMEVAHGQMKEKELEAVMKGFMHEEFQVLVCTMIIESGLDIPNVNTMIVNRADRFGLAQLYQLRGRIGRSHRQAFAYLLTPPRSLLAADARKRLSTISEHTRLGSGFQIAMRDLEIRGAGNLLGAEQSGYINTVGFEMYTEMLSDAVQRLNSEGVASLPEPTKPKRDSNEIKVEAPVDALLPSDYVPDGSERVELYRRLSRAQKIETVDTMREELRDRYGPLPEVVSNLLEIVSSQIYSVIAGVAKIEIHEDVVFLTFVKEYGGKDFEIRLADMVGRLHDMPVELRGAGPLGLRLSLEGCIDWPERWLHINLLLSSLPEDN